MQLLEQWVIFIGCFEKFDKFRLTSDTEFQHK